MNSKVIHSYNISHRRHYKYAYHHLSLRNQIISKEHHVSPLKRKFDTKLYNRDEYG